MTPDELLERLAGELRMTVGPAVEEPFARTQAFMAAVILERLSRQLRWAEARVAADRADSVALVAELRARLGPTPPARTAAAVAALAALGDLGGARDGGAGLATVGAAGEAAAEGDPGDAGLAEVVAALWADRGELGDEQFGELLAIVRRALRARLDRELEYSA